MSRWTVIVMLFLIALSACSGGPGAETPQSTTTPLVIPQVPETGGEDDISTQIASTTEAPPDAVPSPTGQDSAGTPTAAMATDLPAIVTPTEAQQAAASTSTFPATCPPTQADQLGPFYTPGAPTRAVVGEGYVLEGIVRTADGCAPIPNAVIEVWQAGPDGEYRDEYRATLTSDASGYYRFQGPFPPPYSGRPSHIHLRVSAPGFQPLVTQHYPQNGITSAAFDLVLLPE